MFHIIDYATHYFLMPPLMRCSSMPSIRHYCCYFRCRRHAADAAIYIAATSYFSLRCHGHVCLRYGLRHAADFRYDIMAYADATLIVCYEELEKA